MFKTSPASRIAPSCFAALGVHGQIPERGLEFQDSDMAEKRNRRILFTQNSGHYPAPLITAIPNQARKSQSRQHPA
jgi:hypothetical protein